MGISLAEQETVINYSRTDDKAELYTSDTTVITKMDKLVAKNPAEFAYGKCENIDGEVIAKRYLFPKSLITVRGKTPPRKEYTEEQRAEMAERLRRNMGRN